MSTRQRLSLNYSILFSIGIFLSVTSFALSAHGDTRTYASIERSSAGGAISSPSLASGKMTTALPDMSGYSGGLGERMRTTVAEIGGQFGEEVIHVVDGGMGTTVADSATAFDTRGIQPSLDKLISQSSWFALASGVASIIGLMITLYGTQISTIPFSLYRSYVWNRVLLVSFGIGIIVFAGMQFYTQTEPPGLPPLYHIFSVLHGKRLDFDAVFCSSGTNLWGIILFIGAAILIYGIRYDPMQISKSVMFREHKALLEYRKEQLSSVLGEDDYGNLKSHERHLYDDLSNFHVELQTRLIDTVYGQGPHAMFTRRMRSHDSGKKGDATKATG